MLTALADMPRHGYAVIREVERLSDGQTKLRAGTLYAALDRLARDGLIRMAGEEIVGESPAALLRAHGKRSYCARRRVS